MAKCEFLFGVLVLFAEEQDKRESERLRREEDGHGEF